jgi:hypothetical protein
MRRKRNIQIIILLITLLVFTSPVPLDAYVGLCCGKCGGNMPLNIPGGGVAETHEFRVKLFPNLMRMEGVRDGNTKLGTRELFHDFMAVPTEMDMFMMNFSLGYSFTDDFFAGLMLMYMNKNMKMKNRMGRKWSMKSEGIGDTMLITKYRLFANDLLIPTSQFSLLLGLNLPTGSISEDDDGTRLPYSMQLGSGTFDPIVGFLYQGSSSPWWWGANFLFTSRLYDNRKDYQLGDELHYDLYTMYQPRYDLVAELQLNGWVRGRIRGEMEDAKKGIGHIKHNPAAPYMSPMWIADNYGGNGLDLTVGIQWQPWMFHIMNLQISLPIYQNLHGPQMERDFQLMFNWYIEWPTKWSRRSSAPEALKELGF